MAQGATRDSEIFRGLARDLWLKDVVVLAESSSFGLADFTDDDLDLLWQYLDRKLELVQAEQRRRV